MASPRTYGESCAAAHALDLVGERWALLVARELMLGPKRFTDLREGIPNASPNVLAQRLRELESAGVIRRRKLPPPAASRVYELTDWGAELEPVLQALGRWGSRSPAHDKEAGMSVDSHVMALRTMFNVERAQGVSAAIGLYIEGVPFSVHVEDSFFSIERGEAPAADATIWCERSALAELVWEGGDLGEAVRSGDVRVDGDRRQAERFLRLFPLPEPVPAELVPAAA